MKGYRTSLRRSDATVLKVTLGSSRGSLTFSSSFASPSFFFFSSSFSSAARRSSIALRSLSLSSSSRFLHHAMTARQTSASSQQRPCILTSARIPSGVKVTAPTSLKVLSLRCPAAPLSTLSRNLRASSAPPPPMAGFLASLESAGCSRPSASSSISTSRAQSHMAQPYFLKCPCASSSSSRNLRPMARAKSRTWITSFASKGGSHLAV
mmetsp:Transcript_8809/g.25642  ORF Transcript_8809/g.25642 Transcript_8809/m.25642 type:complete len:209 (+) Transcript_8809:1182-1808(+)